MEQQAIITVKDLRTYFYSDKRCNKVLNGVSFELYKGRTLCVVGESGCGKSVSMLSVMRLLDDNASMTADAILLDGEDLNAKSVKDMRKIQGNDIRIRCCSPPLPSALPSLR